MKAQDVKEYTLNDLDSNFYFRNYNFESYVPLDNLIIKYKKEWKEVLKFTWLNFLENCFYLMLPNLYPDLKYEYELVDGFEPTIDMFVLMAVKNFDEKVLSDKGYYLCDRSGRGYDLGILKDLGFNWIELFYNNSKL